MDSFVWTINGGYWGITNKTVCFFWKHTVL